jgi:xylulokinase
LVTVNVTEGTAYGAALLAGVGTGVYGSVPEACSATVRIVDRIEPVVERRGLYDEYYSVYRSLYGALKPAFDAVAAIG